MHVHIQRLGAVLREYFKGIYMYACTCTVKTTSNFLLEYHAVTNFLGEFAFKGHAHAKDIHAYAHVHVQDASTPVGVPLAEL